MITAMKTDIGDPRIARSATGLLAPCNADPVRGAGRPDRSGGRASPGRLLATAPVIEHSPLLEGRS